MTCVAASDCWAVGAYSTSKNVQQVLIEHNTGAGWTIVGSPDTSPTQDNELFGVTCISASDCWAVGDYLTSGGTLQPLVAQYSGAGWSLVRSPDASTSPSDYLSAVTCVSAVDCWATGVFTTSGNTSQTLIEQYTGTGWNLVRSPDTSTTLNNYLSGVSCVSASDCWAVGNASTTGNANSQALAEQYRGTGWNIVASPIVSGTQDNYLDEVTCISTVDCWAVGFSDSTQDYDQTLVEQYTGTGWSVASTPDTSATQDNFLTAVTCVTAADCWTVGEYLNSGGSDQTLVEQYTGTGWGIVGSSDTSPTANDVLQSVACVSASNCWTAGATYPTVGPIQTLVEQYTPPLPPSPSAFSPSVNGYSFPNYTPPEISASQIERYFPASTGMTYPFFGGLTPPGIAFQAFVQLEVGSGLCYGFATTAVANANDWSPSVSSLFNEFATFKQGANFPPFTTVSPDSPNIGDVLTAYASRQLAYGTFQATNRAWLTAGLAGNQVEFNDIATTVASHPEMVILFPSPSLLASNPGAFYQLNNLSHAVVAYAANPAAGTLSVYDPNDPYTGTGWDGPTNIQLTPDDGVTLIDKNTQIGAGLTGGSPSDWEMFPVPDSYFDGPPADQAWSVQGAADAVWWTASQFINQTTFPFSLGTSPIIMSAGAGGAEAESVPNTVASTMQFQVKGSGTASDLSPTSTSSLRTTSGSSGSVQTTFDANGEGIQVSNATGLDGVSLSLGQTLSTSRGRTVTLSGVTVGPGSSFSLTPSSTSGDITLSTTSPTVQHGVLTISDSGSSIGNATATLTIPAGSATTTIYIDGVAGTAPIYSVTTTAASSTTTLLAGTPQEISSVIANDFASIHTVLAALPRNTLPADVASHLANAQRLSQRFAAARGTEQQISLFIAGFHNISGIPSMTVGQVLLAANDILHLLQAESGR